MNCADRLQYCFHRARPWVSSQPGPEISGFQYLAGWAEVSCRMSHSILLVSILLIRLRPVFLPEPEWYFLRIGKENILPDCSLEKWCGNGAAARQREDAVVGEEAGHGVVGGGRGMQGVLHGLRCLQARLLQLLCGERKAATAGSQSCGPVHTSPLSPTAACPLARADDLRGCSLAVGTAPNRNPPECRSGLALAHNSRLTSLPSRTPVSEPFPGLIKYIPNEAADVQDKGKEHSKPTPRFLTLSLQFTTACNTPSRAPSLILLSGATGHLSPAPSPDLTFVA